MILLYHEYKFYPTKFVNKGIPDWQKSKRMVKWLRLTLTLVLVTLCFRWSSIKGLLNKEVANWEKTKLGWEGMLKGYGEVEEGCKKHWWRKKVGRWDRIFIPFRTLTNAQQEWVSENHHDSSCTGRLNNAQRKWVSMSHHESSCTGRLSNAQQECVSVSHHDSFVQDAE